MSEFGSKRLVRMAIEYAVKNKRSTMTLVHKGNIMKFTEGAFRDWGYEVAKEAFGGTVIDKGPWTQIPDGGPVGKGVIAEARVRVRGRGGGVRRRGRRQGALDADPRRRPGGEGRDRRRDVPAAAAAPGRVLG